MQETDEDFDPEETYTPAGFDREPLPICEPYHTVKKSIFKKLLPVVIIFTNWFLNGRVHSALDDVKFHTKSKRVSVEVFMKFMVMFFNSILLVILMNADLRYSDGTE